MPALPAWYGRSYPTMEKLEAYAWELGAVVMRGPVDAFCSLPEEPDQVAVIGLPEEAGPLESIWLLAHELGHLVLHLGYVSPWSRDRKEFQAERWAARAMIPEARIRRYGNASEDAFIGALSAHYEDLPLQDCPARRLAAHIARARLRGLEPVA